MNVESHDPRLDPDGLRLHPLVTQTECTSARSTITIPRRPLNIESKTSPNSSTVTRNSSVLENPTIAENVDFDDTLAPDFENVKYRMVPHKRNNSNTCVGIKPFGGDFPNTCLASNQCYTTDAGLPPEASAENHPVLPPRRVTLQRSASPIQSIQSGHDSLSPQTTTMSNDSNNAQSSYAPFSRQNTMSNGSNSSNIESVQSDYDVLSPTTVRCALATSHIAAWRVKKSDLKISALAAAVLINEGLLTFKDLQMRVHQLHHSREDILTVSAVICPIPLSKMLGRPIHSQA